jgi:hypothetical protein
VVKAVFAGDSGFAGSSAMAGDLTVTPPSGLFVMPEYALGGLVAFTACFAAFAAYLAVKKAKVSNWSFHI